MVAIDAEPKPEPKHKRVKVSQANFPQIPIEKSLGIIRAIWDQYAGNPTPPYDVALAMKISPTSSDWQYLTGASVAYGLSEGGYRAKTIALTPIGRRIVAPTESGDNIHALREAVMQPNIMRSFYEKYNRAKFPDSNIAENVLFNLGLPKERASTAVEILIANGLATGILRETPTGYFVAFEEPVISPKAEGEAGLLQVPPKEFHEPEFGKQEKITFGKGLYINFEIHIAADTPIDTIVAIFQNMKKYLMDNE
jgi:hypothetical protein